MSVRKCTERTKCENNSNPQPQRQRRKDNAGNQPCNKLAELLSNGRITPENFLSSKVNQYSAVFSLEDTGKYVNLKTEEFVDRKKKRSGQIKIVEAYQTSTIQLYLFF